MSHCSMHQRSFNLRINNLLSAAFPCDSLHELKLYFVSCQCLIYSCSVCWYILCGIAMFGTTVRFKRTGHLGLCELWLTVIVFVLIFFLFLATKKWPPASNKILAAKNVKYEWPTVMKINTFIHLVKMSSLCVMCTNFCKKSATKWRYNTLLYVFANSSLHHCDWLNTSPNDVYLIFMFI